MPFQPTAARSDLACYGMYIVSCFLVGGVVEWVDVANEGTMICLVVRKVLGPECTETWSKIYSLGSLKRF